MKFKKALSPVVSFSLLIIVAVISIAAFQSWYSTYSSSLFSEAEVESNEITSGIVDVRNGKLYFRSAENQTITQVNIKGTNCLNQTNATKGMNTLNVSSCLNNITGQYEAVVQADKVYSKYFYSSDVMSFVENQQVESSCDISFGFEPANSVVGSGESSFTITDSSLEAPDNGDYIFGLDSYVDVQGDEFKGVAFNFTSVSPSNLLGFKIFDNQGSIIYDSGYSPAGYMSSVTELAIGFNSTHVLYYADGALGASFSNNGNPVNFALVSSNGSITMEPKLSESEFGYTYSGMEGLCSEQTQSEESGGGEGNVCSEPLTTDLSDASGGFSPYTKVGNTLSTSLSSGVTLSTSFDYPLQLPSSGVDFFEYSINQEVTTGLRFIGIGDYHVNQDGSANWERAISFNGSHWSVNGDASISGTHNDVIGVGIENDGSLGFYQNGVLEHTLSSGTILDDYIVGFAGTGEAHSVDVIFEPNDFTYNYTNSQALNLTCPSEESQQSGNGSACYFRMNATEEQVGQLEEGAQLFSLSNNDETITYTYDSNNPDVVVRYALPSFYMNESEGIFDISSYVNLTEGITAITLRLDSLPEYSYNPNTVGFGGISIVDADKMAQGNTIGMTSLFSFNSSGSWAMAITNDSSSDDIFNISKELTTSESLPIEISMYFNADTQRMGFVVDDVDSGYRFDYEPGERYIINIFNGQTSNLDAQLDGEELTFTVLSRGEDITNTLPSGTTDMCGNTIS